MITSPSEERVIISNVWAVYQVFLNTYVFSCDNLLLSQDFCIHLGEFIIFH